MDGAGEASRAVVLRGLAMLEGLFKLKQTSLLVLSMYAAFIVAGGLRFPLRYHLLVVGVAYAAIAAVTAINMYFDRDIDALMQRTRHRPLASGAIRPGLALALSLAMLATSITLAAIFINMYYAAAIILGFLFDVVAYTILLKRRTPLSIVAGAVAGGAPSLGGWAAAAGGIDVNAILFSLLVVSWVPPHIWFLASYYAEDYRRANVPMLPVVSDHTVTAVGVGLGAMMMAYSVAGLAATHAIGVAAAAYGLAAAVHIFKLAVDFSTLKSGHKSFAYRAFRRVNMHLGVFYAILIAEKLLGAA